MPFLKKFEIRNSKFEKLKAGFTLIEFLLVLGLLSITIGSSLLFLTNLLKGSNQANISAETKQNGQATLDLLERRIRNATNAEQLGSPGDNHIRLKLDNDVYLHVQCVAPVPPPPGVNGDIEVGEMVGITDNPSSWSPITNRDTVSGVNVSLCSLRARAGSTGGGAPPVVDISFTLEQGIAAPSRQDFVASSKFQTSVSLRYY